LVLVLLLRYFCDDIQITSTQVVQCIAVLAAEASVYSWTYTVMPCGHVMQTDRVTVAVCTARAARRSGVGQLRQLGCWYYQSPLTSNRSRRTSHCLHSVVL